MKFSFLNETIGLVQIYHKDVALDGDELPLHYGGYDLVWNDDHVFQKYNRLLLLLLDVTSQL